MNINKRIKNGKTKLNIISLLLMFTFVFISVSDVQAFAATKSVEEMFISEENYAEEMEAKVEPYLESIVESGYFTGEEELSIYYQKYVLDNAKGSIIISHGFSEFLGRQTEMIYYFLQQGYSVFTLEHRGHGRSGLLGSDDSQILVEDFDYYVEDLKTYIDEIVIPDSKDNNLYIFAHSMGGAIATRFIEVYPEYITSAVLSAPMFQVNTGSYPAIFAKTLANVMNFIGLGQRYVLGEAPYSDEYYFETCGTTSQARYDYSYNIVVENKEYQRGGASYKWLKEALAATKEITSKKNASLVETPILLFQAENDTMVLPDGQDKFAEYAQNCELIKVDGARHEIYRENDELLKPYLAKIFNFFEENN